MSTDQPGPGSPDDPFGKRPGDGDGPPSGEDGPYGGGPYGSPPPGAGGPYGGGGQGGGPYDEGPEDPFGGGQQGPDPLAGMPPLARSGKRVTARVIDIVVVLVPAYLLELLVVGAHGHVSVGRSALGGVFAAGIGFLYEWYPTKATGQTIGKRAMGIRTAMLADGSVPTSAASAVRALILWVPVFCCYCVWFLLIGITVAFDKPYRQGVHDKAAKTVVVEIP
jgi:uncharacterized RDD family membrane protein YckC